MLGRAYSSQDEKLRKQNVFDCCSSDGMPDGHHGPCAMGVDNDDKKHIVIGTKRGNGKYNIIKVLKLEDKNQNNFNLILDLIGKYRVKSCVSDLRPNADAARQFQKAAIAKGCKTFLCEYNDSPLQDYAFNDTNGVVKVYRTGIFDASHRAFVNQDIILPYRCDAMDEFAIQCCNCVKSKEIDKRKRTIVYRYKKTGNGNDHYRNALNYFLVAASKIGYSRPDRQSKTADCIMEYSAV
jgi:hypothetical protein